MWVLGGGRVAPNPSNEVDIYDPGTDSWSVGAPFVNPRRNFAADSDPATGRVWLAGGYDASGINPSLPWKSSPPVLPARSPVSTDTPVATDTAVATDTPVATDTAVSTDTPTAGSPTETPTACTLSFEDVPPATRSTPTSSVLPAEASSTATHAVAQVNPATATTTPTSDQATMSPVDSSPRSLLTQQGSTTPCRCPAIRGRPTRINLLRLHLAPDQPRASQRLPVRRSRGAMRT